jgi:predicted metal-dependent phosphoesterase TrpH
MRIDIHVHSSYSSDGTAKPEEILMHAKKLGLNGVVITDHNEIRGSLKLWKGNKGKADFVVLPGMEVSSTEGHILALGVTESVPRDLSPRETINKIQKLGGLAIASHPYRFWSGLGEETVREAKFEVIEVTNSRSLKKENIRANRLAEELGCGMTGGSDCHSLTHLGDAYTEFLEVKDPSSDMDTILEEIRKGRTKGYGGYRSRGETPRYVISCVSLWLRRGMKKI